MLQQLPVVCENIILFAGEWDGGRDNPVIVGLN